MAGEFGLLGRCAEGVLTTAEVDILDGATVSTDELNILDGVTATAAELNILDGVTKTATQINALVIGVAGGYKLARGSKVVTGTASKATGLTTMVGYAVSARADTATKANTAVVVSGEIGSTAGNIKIYRWKHTSAGTTTLIAATSAGTVDWLAVGT